MASQVHSGYEDLLKQIRDHGTLKADRTGTGTKSIFGAQIRYDLAAGFPLLTSKKVYFKGVAGELLWFLNGDSNVRWLQQNNIHIWDEWADQDGNLGPIYGVQWRSWPTPDGNHIDQISQVVNQIKTNPDSRRLLVSAWNVAEIENMALPPCHLLFQFYVADGKLSCQLYQRSADMFLGVPFNIASYSLLTHMVAQQCDLAVGEFIWTGGDCHIYTNHFAAVDEQLSRDIRPFPTLELNKASDLFSYTLDDIKVTGYNPHPAIKAEVSV